MPERAGACRSTGLRLPGFLPGRRAMRRAAASRVCRGARAVTWPTIVPPLAATPIASRDHHRQAAATTAAAGQRVWTILRGGRRASRRRTSATGTSVTVSSKVRRAPAVSKAHSQRLAVEEADREDEAAERREVARRGAGGAAVQAEHALRSVVPGCCSEGVPVRFIPRRPAGGFGIADETFKDRV